MRKSLVLYITLILVAGCTDNVDSNTITKASTNTGLLCPVDNVEESDFTVKAIYGEDNRLDWYESPGRTKDYWAKATLALIPSYGLTADGDDFVIDGATYGQVANLCPGQPYRDQPSSAFCSAFLVSDDLVVTAGHCVRDLADCQSTMFVFDYAKTEAGQSDFRVPQTSVYNCQEVVHREVGENDFAVVRLNRKVEDRVPLNVRRQGQVALEQQVMLIGHPMGLPSKIADGGFVLGVGSRIIASVDAFAANSGSVILNSETGVAEGILVAGEPDFQYVNGCRVEYRCDGTCRGEVITPISLVLPFIPDQVYENPICTED